MLGDDERLASVCTRRIHCKRFSPINGMMRSPVGKLAPLRRKSSDCSAYLNPSTTVCSGGPARMTARSFHQRVLETELSFRFPQIHEITEATLRTRRAYPSG
jgi:hypothetical protein